MYAGYMLSCNKCNNKNVKRWIDGVCSSCRKEPPTTDQLLSISFTRLNSMNRELNSMNSKMTFFTVLVIINLIGILIWLFGM